MVRIPVQAVSHYCHVWTMTCLYGKGDKRLIAKICVRVLTAVFDLEGSQGHSLHIAKTCVLVILLLDVLNNISQNCPWSKVWHDLDPGSYVSLWQRSQCTCSENLSGPKHLTVGLDLDNISHKCSPWPKDASWHWLKVISPRSMSHWTHSQNR